MSKAEPAALFAALGDPTRVGMIARLSDGEERSITAMGEGLPMSRQAVAKHLDVLHGAGLVQRRKSGREVHFALQREAIDAARTWLEDVGVQGDKTPERLGTAGEGD